MEVHEYESVKPPVFGGEYLAVSSNHLHIRLVWKSLVASVCAARV